MNRPRIAYLTGEYPRATDTFIQREVAGLRNGGFEVDTFAVRRPGPEHLVGPEQEQGQATTTYLLELARSTVALRSIATLLVRHPRSAARGLKLAWETKRDGIRGTTLQLIYFLEAVLLAQQIRSRKIDHLHNHFGDSSCTVAMLAAEVANVPYSFTLHGPAIFFEAKTWRLDAKLDRAAFCAAISHFARSQAAIFASSESLERIHIIHCGVEPQKLTPIDYRDRATRLIFVGRIVELKGLGILLEAIGQLTKQAPDLTLTVVGDGPDKAKLAARAKQLGLGDRVDFVGAKSQAEVATLLSESDIFALPSFAEGVPVVLMEALGSGLPAIASIVGGITELIEDGVNGFLVRPSDVDHLADRIERLLEDRDLREKMGQAGRAKVNGSFDSTAEAARLGTLFVNNQRGISSPVRPELPGSGDPALS